MKENLNITKFVFIGHKEERVKGMPYSELRDLGFLSESCPVSLIKMGKYTF